MKKIDIKGFNIITLIVAYLLLIGAFFSVIFGIEGISSYISDNHQIGMTLLISGIIMFLFSILTFSIRSAINEIVKRLNGEDTEEEKEN